MRLRGFAHTPILAATVLAAAALVPVSPVSAAPESLTVTPDTPLRFGTFVVISQGSRTVNANGTVINAGVFPLPAAVTGPAQFTVTYDRGNNSPKPLNITFQVILGSVATVRQAGVTGTISAFDSDLAGANMLTPGQAYSFTIANCVARTCSKSFRVGGKLDVTQSSGGADLTIALPMIANLISSDRP